MNYGKFSNSHKSRWREGFEPFRRDDDWQDSVCYAKRLAQAVVFCRRLPVAEESQRTPLQWHERFDVKKASSMLNKGIEECAILAEEAAVTA